MSISEEPDFSRLDDSAIISMREEMRGELERLPPRSRDHANSPRVAIQQASEACCGAG
jgi:hypothetical protein